MTFFYYIFFSLFYQFIFSVAFHSFHSLSKSFFLSFSNIFLSFSFSFIFIPFLSFSVLLIYFSVAFSFLHSFSSSFSLLSLICFSVPFQFTHYSYSPFPFMSFLCSVLWVFLLLLPFYSSFLSVFDSHFLSTVFILPFQIFIFCLLLVSIINLSSVQSFCSYNIIIPSFRVSYFSLIHLSFDTSCDIYFLRLIFILVFIFHHCLFTFPWSDYLSNSSLSCLL